MKILTFNVRVWTRDTDKSSPYFWIERAKAMNRMIHDLDPDVICFQELSFPMSLAVPVGYKRCGISISHHIYVRKGIKTKSPKFRIFWNSVDLKEAGIRVFCIHGKWTDKVNAKMSKEVLGRIDRPSIACGDFNMNIDDLEKYGFDRNKSARVILGHDSKDTFQNFTKEYQHDEIDHFYMFGVEPKSYQIIDDNYGVEKLSDHKPILLTI